MAALQELARKARREPITIKELEAVDRRVEALSWEARVRGEFASCLSAGARAHRSNFASSNFASF